MELGITKKTNPSHPLCCKQRRANWSLVVIVVVIVLVVIVVVVVVVVIVNFGKWRKNRIHTWSRRISDLIESSHLCARLFGKFRELNINRTKANLSTIKCNGRQERMD